MKAHESITPAFLNEIYNKFFLTSVLTIAAGYTLSRSMHEDEIAVSVFPSLLGFVNSRTTLMLMYNIS